jgi:hypothetical protein
MKDGTESGGHNLRVSASKTPIRSNGYAAGRAKQAAAAGTGAAAPMAGPPMGAAAATPATAPPAPSKQMSPEEIVDAINADLCRAVDEARANGTLVT